MNEIIAIILLSIAIAIFDVLFDKYMTVSKTISTVTCEFGMLFLLLGIVIFAKQQHMMVSLLVLLVIIFVNKFKKYNKE